MTTSADAAGHWKAFDAKMGQEGLHPFVINTFAHYYRQILSGETGLIDEHDIQPVTPEDIADWRQLDQYAAEGKAQRPRAVMIVLNGGLGTSMGLQGPKSLLPVKNKQSFLQLILANALRQQIELAFMNSFSTQADTLAAVERLQPSKKPLFFLQHKFPKVLRPSLAPAAWPPNPALEWNPPGHGDIYAALHTSGMLKDLLARDIQYAFICNSDNLGAVLEPSLLGYFSAKGLPFMMEVADRTPADSKGGHLARHSNGRLLLREAAQCPPDQRDTFQDIRRHRFFNTNNVWIDLAVLADLINTQGVMRLPVILNPKTLDPRDPQSPPVIQVESAMGAAIALFEGAAAVRVPRTRFFPVKKCQDLLAVRSDCFVLNADGALQLHPQRRDVPLIGLDRRYYGKIDQFDARFPQGVPSLLGCEALTIEGDVRFEDGVTIKKRVTIANRSDSQAVIPAGSLIDTDMTID